VRVPAAEQRIAIGRERRPLLPALPDRACLRHVGVVARLLLAQRVVPLLVGLLLALLLLLLHVPRPLLLGILAQRAGVPAELLGGRRAALRRRRDRHAEHRCEDDDPEEQAGVHGRPPRRFGRDGDCDAAGDAVVAASPLPARYRRAGCPDRRHRLGALQRTRKNIRSPV
jgi:hypothetical protein